MQTLHLHTCSICTYETFSLSLIFCLLFLEKKKKLETNKETDKSLPCFFSHFWFICFSFYTSSSCRRAISHNVDLHSPNALLWWIPVFSPCLMDHTQQRWDSLSLSLVLFLLLFLFPNCHLLTAVLISAIQTRLVSLTLKSTLLCLFSPVLIILSNPEISAWLMTDLRAWEVARLEEMFGGWNNRVFWRERRGGVIISDIYWFSPYRVTGLWA